MDVNFDLFNWELNGNDLSPLAVPVPPDYPSVDLVYLGTVFANGALVGNLLTTVQPDEPTLVAVDSRDGAHAVLTLTGTSAGTSNELFVSTWGQQGAQSWRSVGTLSGDGTITIDKPQGLYACKVISSLPR